MNNNLIKDWGYRTDSLVFYAKRREECEKELAKMIEQKKKEIAALKKKAKTA